MNARRVGAGVGWGAVKVSKADSAGRRLQKLERKGWTPIPLWLGPVCGVTPPMGEEQHVATSPNSQQQLPPQMFPVVTSANCR